MSRSGALAGELLVSEQRLAGTADLVARDGSAELQVERPHGTVDAGVAPDAAAVDADVGQLGRPGLTHHRARPSGSRGREVPGELLRSDRRAHADIPLPGHAHGATPATEGDRV